MQPAAPAAQLPAKKEKVPINPFGHLLQGIKKLITTNFISLLVVALVQAVVTILLMVVLVGGLTASIANGISTGSFAGVIVALIVFLLIFAAVSAYFGAALNRVIVTGAREQKATAGDAFSVAAKRFPLAVKYYLLLFGIFIAYYIVLLGIGVGLKSPGLAALFGIIGFVLLLILLVRWIYASYMIVDDTPPASLKSMLTKSYDYVKVSSGALALYIILLIVLYIIFAIAYGATESSSNYQSSTYPSDYSSLSGSRFDNSPSTTSAAGLAGMAVGGVIVASVIGTVLGAMVSAGAGHIYNAAREIKGDTAGGTPPEDNHKTPAEHIASNPQPETPAEPPKPTEQF
jgi:hypothetical protein